MMNYVELEKYLRQLFQQYLNKFNLSVEDKDDVIQNTMIKLFTKEKDGTLTGDVENNKNYIFITLRNYVFQQGTSKFKIHTTIEGYDVPSTEKSIIDLMDTEIKIKAINKKMEKKSFNDKERLIWSYLCKGYKLVEIEKEIDMSLSAIRVNWQQMKKKMRGQVYSKPKYLLEYHTSGKKLYFLNQKELLEYTKISPDTWDTYKKLGKTIFPKYKIQKL